MPEPQRLGGRSPVANTHTRSSCGLTRLRVFATLYDYYRLDTCRTHKYTGRVAVDVDVVTATTAAVVRVWSACVSRRTSLLRNSCRRCTTPSRSSSVRIESCARCRDLAADSRFRSLRASSFVSGGDGSAVAVSDEVRGAGGGDDSGEVGARVLGPGTDGVVGAAVWRCGRKKMSSR